MIENEIYKNFTELNDYPDLRLLNQSFYKDDDMIDFNIHFDNNVLENVSPNNYTELNDFIFEILNEYPKLFPKIVNSKNNSNASRLDSTYEKQFIEEIDKLDFSKATYVFLSKKIIDPTRDTIISKEEKDKIENIITSDLCKAYITCQKILANSPTKNDIKNDIKNNFLIVKFGNKMTKKQIDNLSTYITDEISLRIADRDEYIILDNKIITLLDEFKDIKHNKIREIIVKRYKEYYEAREIWNYLNDNLY